jgi:PadR family transcriptional regulator PadR
MLPCPEKSSQSKHGLGLGPFAVKRGKKSGNNLRTYTSKETSVPVDVQQEGTYTPVAHLKEKLMAPPRGEVLQGTLDLIVLKTLEALGPLHGYGIAQRIQQVSEDLLQLNQGTLYPALLRLEQRGWISSKWGSSENNRKAKYYSLTRTGRKQLVAETESWERMTALMTRLLGGAEGA